MPPGAGHEVRTAALTCRDMRGVEAKMRHEQQEQQQRRCHCNLCQALDWEELPHSLGHELTMARGLKAMLRCQDMLWEEFLPRTCPGQKWTRRVEFRFKCPAACREELLEGVGHGLATMRGLMVTVKCQCMPWQEFLRRTCH